MRLGTRRLVALAAVGVLGALSLTACGSDTSDDGGDGGSSDSAKKVGVILPDATTSPRWEANDRPSLQQAFDDAGIESTITNADGDVAKFGSICDSMINEGVQVLMIVNLDSESGSACLKKAKDAGIQSIDYDRLTLGGGASYYVSFDNVKVGDLMGEGLTKCLDDAGKTKANIVFINGDPNDNNAALFKSGYQQNLQPKFDSGDYKLVGDQTGEWDATKAGTAFEQIFTQNNGKVDGVVSANDTMAGGIIARLKANGLDGKVPVTGQDASVEGLQRILAGTQCMTVYKDTNLEAKAASDLAIALINGDKEKAASLASGTVKDTELNVDVPSALATPEIIYTDGVAKVISDGFQSADDVCTGQYAKLCQENGVQ
ncbi:sugar ABC transporter substrate-binding protein [Nocardioides guangzhouensis]|uniref:Sugar ABC transporter substrate-binding protein n=1 Tax=Nocardioides guangzhouensis TaxID=2497878 RepID=A0A4Q4ZAJ3_9ACTN|nr:substrate-binding domain-containing protein [Nocardioides guangzhouensis]RYP84912.1 sugar ABC transporter substrate-binding protein [Nocardioides guangzhouensis]